MELRPEDRVLLLALTSFEEIPALAAQLSEGICVGVLEGDAIYEARRLLRDCPNVMMVPAEPDGTLPWREGFFSVVVAPALAEPTPEILRVLAPGGTAWLADGPFTRR
jgi:hypothetical protein